MVDVELLALCTGESLAVYRVGPLVVKLLRPLHHFRRFPFEQSPRERLAELAARERLSWSQLDLDRAPLVILPLVYCTAANAIVSLAVAGRRGTIHDERRARQLLRVFRPPLRLTDLHPDNLIVRDGRIFVIDFRVRLR